MDSDGTAAITSVTALFAIPPAVSVTVIVTGKLPEAVGVPDSTPVLAFRVSPAGRLPLLTDQVRLPVPPVAVSASR